MPLIEFTVEAIEHDSRGMVVRGRCCEESFGLGDVFSTLEKSRCELDGETGNRRPTDSEVVANVELRVEEINFHGRKETWLFLGGNAGLRLSGSGLELLTSLKQEPGVVWLLAGASSLKPGSPPDRRRMSEVRAALRDGELYAFDQKLDMPLRLPAEFVEFLDAGLQLQYDPEDCEAGHVILKPRSELKVRWLGATLSGTGSPHEDDDPHPGPGVYLVPGVDLVQSCTGDYGPEGLLVWLPDEQTFGTGDHSHDQLLVFGAQVGWSDVLASPARYINAQWPDFGLECAPGEYLVPWPKYPHQ